MSNLIEILSNQNQNIDIKNNQKIKPNQNFMLELLKDSEPQKAIDLLKNLNLTNEEIKEIISKLPEKNKRIYLQLLNKEIINSKTQINNKIQILTDKKTENKSLEKNLKNSIKNLLKLLEEIDLKENKLSDNNNWKLQPTKKNENQIENVILTKNNSENILFLLLNTPQNIPEKIKKEINPIKKEITQLIKKEIDANTLIENKLLTKKVITKIKNTASFEELVSIANKNGLNIKKIVTKIIKKSLPQKPKLSLKPKIASFNQNHIKINPNKIISKTINVTKKTNLLQNLLSNNSLKNENFIHIDNTKNTIKHETENPNIPININNTTFNIKHKIISAKESIKHFSNNLKEAIENYKPPISKLSIELHPKELGKVEITLIHRGENLQININSNNQAINFFHIHQIELKNTLVNMGYSGIDMNFNSNQNKENQEKKAFKQYNSNKNNEDYDELIIEIPYTYA
jgi:flagellar hook-length control protein FliK